MAAKHFSVRMRKDAGLEITDRIQLKVSPRAPQLTSALLAHQENIAGEVLAAQFQLEESLPEGIDIEFEGQSVRVLMEKL